MTLAYAPRLGIDVMPVRGPSLILIPEDACDWRLAGPPSTVKLNGLFDTEDSVQLCRHDVQEYAAWYADWDWPWSRKSIVGGLVHWRSAVCHHTGEPIVLTTRALVEPLTAAQVQQLVLHGKR